MAGRLPFSSTVDFFCLSCALEKELGEELTRNLKTFLDIFYANDLTYAITEESQRAHTKKVVPKKLKKYNLHGNHTKTEEGDAPDRRPPPPPPPPPPSNPHDRILWSELD